MDAANLLKPMLARGELRAVGATTLDEYRKHIEKDAALERRFQPVMVGEPSVEDTIAILRGLKERYEVHHGVRIQDAALVAAARLSDRYITDALPAGQGDRPHRRGREPPAHRDRLGAGRAGRGAAAHHAARDRAAGAGGETDAASAARRDAIARELAELREEADAMRAHWEQEKATIAAHPRHQGADRGRAPASWSGPSARPTCEGAARLRYGTLPELERALEASQRRAGRAAGGRAACSRRRSTRRTSPRWWPPGPASRSAA